MNIDLSKQEAWKIIDAVVAYRKDYSVTGVVRKILDNIESKMKKITKDS